MDEGEFLGILIHGRYNWLKGRETLLKDIFKQRKEYFKNHLNPNHDFYRERKVHRLKVGFFFYTEVVKNFLVAGPGGG